MRASARHLLRAGASACTWQDEEEELPAASSAHRAEALIGVRVESGGDQVLTLATGAELKLFADGRAPDEPTGEGDCRDYFVPQAATPLSASAEPFTWSKPSLVRKRTFSQTVVP